MILEEIDMEINHYEDSILGVVTTENIVEGRLVLLTSHIHDKDFGSLTDLPGVKLPANTTEASRAHFCITFAQDNQSLPIYQPQPGYDWALRYGFDRADNAPFSATVYLTHPSVQEGLTIPSGAGALAFGAGIYTVPSGAYIYNSALTVPGATLTAADTASDGATNAGKLKYSTSNIVAEVVKFDTESGKLTFRILR